MKILFYSLSFFKSMYVKSKLRISLLGIIPNSQLADLLFKVPTYAKDTTEHNVSKFREELCLITFERLPNFTILLPTKVYLFFKFIQTNNIVLWILFSVEIFMY